MDNERSLSYLFIYGMMQTGGIETLIVRMSNWLINKGHKVTVLLYETGDLVKLLDEKVEIDILGNKRYFFFIPFFGARYLKRYKERNIDLIYSFGPAASYFASYVYKYGFDKQKPVFMNGIYHPNEFKLEGSLTAIDIMHIDLYNGYICDRSKVFMSAEVRSGNEPILGKQVSDSITWPLPVDGERFQNTKRNIIPYKIVSIGRFADFKTYNLYMFDVIEDLVRMGYDVTWDVYGYGPLESKMRSLLKNKKLSDRVILKGPLPYDRMVEALSVAHVFVGVGTALIEAGFFRIPCIPGIQDDMKGVTYGAIYNLPYYTCGEILPDTFKTILVKDAILRIFKMSKDEYSEECNRTYDYVQPYSIDKLMEQFVTYAFTVPVEQKIDAYPGWRFSLYSARLILAYLRSKIALRSRLKKYAVSMLNILTSKKTA